MINFINLGELDVDIKSVVDYGTEWVYRKIHKPYNDKPTTYWNLFYKNKDLDDYNIIPGVLSSKYTIVKTQDIVENIKKSLGGDVTDPPKIVRNTSDISVSFTLEEFEFRDKIEDSSAMEEDHFLFNLLTDINIDEIKRKTSLSFNVINSMTGSRSVILRYGFYTKIIPNIKSIKPLLINNTYILDDFANQLSHGKNLNITYHEVANVQKNISNKIDEYKNTPVSDETIELFKKYNFLIKPVKMIMSIWNNLPKEYKNFYYFTMIISYVVSGTRHINLELKMRRFIKQEFKKVNELKIMKAV